MRASVRYCVVVLLGTVWPHGIALAVVGAAGSGTVEGEVDLPKAGVEEPRLRYGGFIERIKNPVMPIKSFDPRPECVVYLEGGPAAESAARPSSGAVTWELGPVSFHAPLLPVVAGTEVVIKNVSKNVSHALYADDADFFKQENAAGPLGPGGDRRGVAKATNKAVVVRSSDSPHLEARVVAFPTRYFARVDARTGRFKIEDVPAGKWTVRVWYRDAWLATPAQTVEVNGKSTTTKITLPERVEASPPAKGK